MERSTEVRLKDTLGGEIIIFLKSTLIKPLMFFSI